MTSSSEQSTGSKQQGYALRAESTSQTWSMLDYSDFFREKRRNRGTFDLLTAVHKAEYDNVKRPVNKKTSKLIEPAHKFEINLEGDSCTKEK